MLCLLALVVLTACTPICERENVICDPAPPPLGPAISPPALLDVLYAALLLRDVELYGDLLSDDFAFVDATTAT